MNNNGLMNFIRSIVEYYLLSLRRWFDGDGVSSRREFFFSLPGYVINLAVYLALNNARVHFIKQLPDTGSWINQVVSVILFAIILLLPFLPLYTLILRRLRDGGKSYAWLYAVFIPNIGILEFIKIGIGVYVLCLLCQPTDSLGVISEYSKAIEINPKDAYAYFKRGLAKYNSKDYQGAIADWTKAIEINPQYADAYSNRGNAKNGLGDNQGAIADYSKAIEINPQHDNAYNNRGGRKAESGDTQGAIADFNKAIEINPQDAVAYNNRGIVKGRSGDNQGAIADWTKAIAINPQ